MTCSFSCAGVFKAFGVEERQVEEAQEVGQTHHEKTGPSKGFSEHLNEYRLSHQAQARTRIRFFDSAHHFTISLKANFATWPCDMS